MAKILEGSSNIAARMQFQFKQSSCVAVGTFNIYIVQPRLLNEMGVLNSKTPILVSGDLTQPGTRFEAADCKWVVRPDRLSIETTKPHVDCGVFVKRTLEALRLTPIMGIGVNAVFTANREAEQELPESVKLPQHADAMQRTVHLAIEMGESTLNIQLACARDAMELSLNLHTDFSKIKDKLKEVNESARTICGSFLEKRDAAVEIARELLKAEFVYDQ